MEGVLWDGGCDRKARQPTLANRREKNQDMGGKRIVALESLILTFYESHGDIFNDYLDLFNFL